jgi:hypothetical protein
MNRRFKENSRFASLIEEKPVNKNSDNNKIEQPRIEKSENFNSFKNEQPPREYSSFNKNYRERREEIMERIEKEEKKRKEEEERIKEEEKKVALAMESFPELAQVNKKVHLEIVDNTANFLETLKKVDTSEKPVQHIIQVGWTELTREKKSSETNFFYNKKDKDTYFKTPDDLAYDVLENLVYLHEKRKDEYIQCWGKDEWDNMFTFPNYDYHYFDKLDEIYEKNNKESDYEYESEEDEY